MAGKFVVFFHHLLVLGLFLFHLEGGVGDGRVEGEQLSDLIRVILKDGIRFKKRLKPLTDTTHIANFSLINLYLALLLLVLLILSLHSHLNLLLTGQREIRFFLNLELLILSVFGL